MGWAELTLDLRDVDDVQEGIAWAEATSTHPSTRTFPRERRTGSAVRPIVKVPDEDRYLHLAGWVPVRNPDAGRGYNLTRRRP